MLVGYARVSTVEQTLALQQDTLTKAGCQRTSTDTASGWLTERPGLAEALAFARPGDTLVIWRLDRLGRSLRHLIDTVAVLAERGIGLKSLHSSWTPPPAAALVFYVFVLDAFERDLVRERTQAGLRAARIRGRLGGRPKALDPRKSVSEVARRWWPVRAAARVRKPQYRSARRS